MKARYIVVIVLGLLLFLAWRFVRPMNIFVVSDQFAWPIDTSQTKPPLNTLRAEECGACHQQIYKEWKTSIHSQAWTDPYFQADFKFEKQQYICRTCHTPLDRQLPELAVDYLDKNKWYPVLEKNPNFDEKIQREGVTCAVCHFREGKIRTAMAHSNAPHPLSKLDSPNRVCVRCHVVSGKRWDTFFTFPPCGTVAEIETSKGKGYEEDSKDMSTEVVDGLGCVNCHMPLEERPLVPGGKPHQTRRHLWRGGHDPQMVKGGLTITFQESTTARQAQRVFTLNITNTGADHYLPTGTPDRHLVVRLRILDGLGNVLDKIEEKLIRTVLWRPIILDLKDTRLPPNEPRLYSIEMDSSYQGEAMFVEADVRYYLVAEKRLKRIGYQGKDPLNYEVYRQRISLASKAGDQPE